MNNYYVYAYIRTDYYTPFYIGKGKDNRANVLQHRSKHFMNIYNKTECFVILLYTNLTEDEAFKKEKEVINNLIDYGYTTDMDEEHNKNGKHLVNMTNGGEGASGRIMTEEQRRRLSDTHKGESNPMYGKHMNETSKAKMIGSLKKVERTQEWNDKISVARTTVLYVGCDKYGNIKVKLTPKQLIEQGYSPSHVCNCCQGKRKTHKKLYWHKESMEV